MAKAVINLQKESGGIVKISPVDGVGVTEVTVPESGELATKEYVDARAGAAPKGLISMWSGSIATIPNDWALCDGTNGTPDLRDRFVVGAGSSYSVGNTGGSKDAVVVSHTHTASTDSQGSHGHTSYGYRIVGGGGSTGYNAGLNADFNQARTTSTEGAHGHNIAVSTNGESGTNKNLPPYYALCYIMKT